MFNPWLIHSHLSREGCKQIRELGSSFLSRLPTAAIDALCDRSYDPARFDLARRPVRIPNGLGPHLMDGRKGGRRMGVALGWVAFALAGVAAAPHPGRQTDQITYTVRYVEAEGLGWRGRSSPVSNRSPARGRRQSIPSPRRENAASGTGYQEPGRPASSNPEGHGVQRRRGVGSFAIESQARDPGCLEGRGSDPSSRYGRFTRRLAHDDGGTQARPGHPGPDRRSKIRRFGPSII